MDQQIADRVALVESIRASLADARERGDGIQVATLRRRLMAALADLQRVRGF